MHGLLGISGSLHRWTSNSGGEMGGVFSRCTPPLTLSTYDGQLTVAVADVSGWIKAALFIFATGIPACSDTIVPWEQLKNCHSNTF